jgi:hypothetical protein
MKALWGALVVDGRNKIGGHVASKNRGGSYFRTKVSPAQPSSSYSAAVRSRLASISSAWRSLTAAQRSQWNDAVANFKKTDIFGNVRNPSGFNLYQELNNNLVNTGTAQITVPPTPEAVDALTSLSIVADNSSNSLTLTYAPAIAADHKAIIRATPAISPGKSFVKSEFRQIKVAATADASPLAVSADYITKFGAIGAVGQKIFVEVIEINTTTGQKGRSFQASTIIVA